VFFWVLVQWSKDINCGTLNPETKKSMLSRSVVFNESEMYYSNRATNAHDTVP
jgi:hypothetical protein